MMRRVKGMRPLVGVLFLGGALVLGACSATANNGAKVSAPNSGSSSGASSQVQQILQKVKNTNPQNAQANSMMQFKNSQGNVLATFKSNGPVTFQPYQLRWTTTTNLGNNSLKSQEILTNGKLYVRSMNASTWQEINLSALASRLNSNSSQSGGNAAGAANLSLQNILNLSNARVVNSSASVNGTTAYEIQGQTSNVINASNGNGQSTTQNVRTQETLYVDKSNYHVLRVDLQGQPQQGMLTSTTTFSSWNSANPSISAPPASQVAHCRS